MTFDYFINSTTIFWWCFLSLSLYSIKITSNRWWDWFDRIQSDTSDALWKEKYGQIITLYWQTPREHQNKNNEINTSDVARMRWIRIFIEKMSQSIKVHSLDLTLNVSATMISSVFFSCNLMNRTPMVSNIRIKCRPARIVS